MGDKLVDDVVESLDDVLRVNSIDHREGIRVIIDAIVNRLRRANWSDEVIRQDLVDRITTK